MNRIITREQLFEKLNSYMPGDFGTFGGEKVAVVEVGNIQDYQKMHIQGAIHLPEENLPVQVQNLFPERSIQVVLYSNGLDAPATDNALHVLEESGYCNLFYYPGGKEDWAGHGLPVEHGVNSKTELGLSQHT